MKTNNQIALPWTRTKICYIHGYIATGVQPNSKSATKHNQLIAIN